MDLILLHGAQHGSWCWSRLRERLEANPCFERIIALDMPGCGRKREREVALLTQDEIVAELNAEVRAAGVSGALLLGHSIAGVLLPKMVAGAPSLYAHLVYLATAVPAPGQSIMELMGTARQGEHPEQVGWPLDPATTAPAEMQRAMFGTDMSAEDYAWLQQEVAKDNTPPAVALEPATRRGYDGRISATYVLTQRDNVLRPSWQRRFSERLGCQRLIEIDTPHEPFITHVHELAELLRMLAAFALPFEQQPPILKRE